MTISKDIKETFFDGIKTSFTLFKIMIPVSIIVKLLSELGFIEIIGEYLTPVMGVIGLPGEFGLVWATTLITNIYGGLIVFFNLSLSNTYTIAQVTVLACVMLVAHTMPIEIRIAQKAGVKVWFMIFFRITCALILGFLLNLIFSIFNIYEEKTNIIWQPEITNPTIQQWAINELRNYLVIFLIITSLLLFMKLLKNLGIIDKLNRSLEPGMKHLGMSKEATPVAIIGLTLGISYGGGIIIKEVKEKMLSKKDAFLSLSLLGLSHSLIEDSLLMLSIGASIIGVVFARVVFTIFVMLILISFINRITTKRFNKFFVK